MSDFLLWLLRAFLGELGDKTFIITVLLASWCPWEGARGSESSRTQQLLVFLGSVMALWCRLFVLPSLSLMQQRNFLPWFDWATFVVILFLVPKAYIEYGRSDGEAKRREEEKQNLRPKKLPPGPPGIPGLDSLSDIQDEVEDGEVAEYGALPKPSASADGALSERMSDHMVSTLMAFFFTLGLVFCAEGEDKSEAVWISAGGPRGTGSVAGALLGVPLAVLVAVFIGFVMERQLSDMKLNFLVLMTLSFLGLIVLSQALLHLGGLEVQAQALKSGENVRAALVEILR